MILETPRLQLKQIRIEDVEDIYEYSKQEKVGPNAGWKPHASIKETLEIAKEVFIGKENIWGIFLKEEDKLIGTIGLIADPKREYEKTKMIGYAIGEPYWGRGIMTEAVTQVIRYGFESLDLELISANCYPSNKRSQRVLEKCHLQYEGTLKRAEKIYDGRVLDHKCYAIQKEDWESK